MLYRTRRDTRRARWNRRRERRAVIAIKLAYLLTYAVGEG